MFKKCRRKDLTHVYSNDLMKYIKNNTYARDDKALTARYSWWRHIE